MTNMELLEAMTGIDGRFIENARPKPKKRGTMPIPIFPLFFPLRAPIRTGTAF